MEKDPFRNCAVCRFMRSLAFSALGAAAAGYLALSLGLERNSAIIVAFFGSLAAVMLFAVKRNGKS